VAAVATVSKAVTNGYEIHLAGSSPTPNVYFSVGPFPQVYQITGTFSGVATTDGLSLLAGSLTATIQ
jgi:hypothetical protein